jgi:uncharacterized membrane protein YhaH (DUF805 family)
MNVVHWYCKRHSNRGDFWWSALCNGIITQEVIPFFIHLSPVRIASGKQQVAIAPTHLPGFLTSR